MPATPLPPTPEPPTAKPLVEPSTEGRVAQKVLKETLRVKRGENVVIEAWTHELDLARAFVLEARKMGARPVVLYEDEEAYWKSLEECDLKDLGQVGDHEWALLSKAQAYVFLWGPADRPRLAGLDPKMVQKLHAYNALWYQRAKRAKLRGARMEIGRATPASAQHFNVALEPWRKELTDATLADTRAIVAEGKRVAKALKHGKVVTIDHPNGTRLELHLRGRDPQIEDGVVGPEDVAKGNNMTSVPGGYVVVALDENAGEGLFRSNRTSYLSAHRAEGGEWTLSKGKLLSYQYRSGGEAFTGPYERAPKKGRDQVGLLSIGLNPKIVQAPQMEDQERGVVLLTLGRNDEQGGTNRVPFMTWLALGGANVTVDGRPVVQAGNIV